MVYHVAHPHTAADTFKAHELRNIVNFDEDRRQEVFRTHDTTSGKGGSLNPKV